jgi:hypothetical protein
LASSYSPAALPRLKSPFPSELHGQVATAEAATLAWADRFGLVRDPAVRDRIAATRSARLAGRVGPWATLPGLLLNADWGIWLFLFDDAFCDESDLGRRPDEMIGLATQVLRVVERGEALEGGTELLGSFLAALGDLRARLLRMATPQQYDRFLAATVAYLLAQTWEAAHRQRRSIAGYDEYVVMRRHSGGVPTCLALIDVTNGFELPGRAWSSRRLRELTDATTDITCWANDILSYPKEVRRSTQVLSLPAVLSRERGLSTEQAMAQAAALYDERVREYQRLEALVLADCDDATRRYVMDLRHWISGNLAWSYETGRYALGMAA